MFDDKKVARMSADCGLRVLGSWKAFWLLNGGLRRAAALQGLSLRARDIRAQFFGVTEVDVNHLGLRLVGVDVQQAANAARQTVGNGDFRSTQQWDGTHAECSSRFGGKSRRQVACGREYGGGDLVELAFQTIGAQQLHEQLARRRQNLRLLIGGHAGGSANASHCHRKDSLSDLRLSEVGGMMAESAIGNNVLASFDAALKPLGAAAKVPPLVSRGKHLPVSSRTDGVLNNGRQENRPRPT